MKVPAHELAQTPLDPVPGHRGADRPADHESYPGRLPVSDPAGVLLRPHEQVTYHARPARPGPGAHGQRELRAATHPGLGRQDQALSLSRPLCRRAARTARPARVRMRSRKPCVLARRRLFGWNVRLLTGAPGWGYSMMGTPDRHACRPRIHPRLPSRTPAFATRAPPPRLRLWKAIVFALPRSPRAAGKPHVHNMWIVLWIVSARLAAWGCEGSAQSG